MSSLQSLASKPIPPAMLQMDFTNIDSTFQYQAEDPEIQCTLSHELLEQIVPSTTEREETVPNTPETEAEIDEWLTAHMNKLVKRSAKPAPVAPTETLRFEPRHGYEKFQSRLEKRLKVLIKTSRRLRPREVRSRQRKVLDWMIGNLLSWDEIQITPSSFRWTCQLNEVNPNQVYEQVLVICVHHGIVPQYARMHLAARKWLDWLPRPNCPRQEKLQRLRRLFTPLLVHEELFAQEELFAAPLLPEAEQDRALRQFKEICTEYRANQDLTRRLLWYHCIRWQIAPFDARERLAIAN